jgi:2-polyprenylphenol 6-hydroxylase
MRVMHVDARASKPKILTRRLRYSAGMQPTKVSNEFDAAVVGTGVVGLAAALALGQAGLATALIGPPTKLTDAPWDARVYAIAPKVLQWLGTLGVAAQLPADRLQPVAHMHIRGVSHARDRGAHEAAPGVQLSAREAKVDALATIMEERALLQTLSSAVAFTRGITRVHGSVTALQQDEARATLQLEDRAISAALVVAADGAQSALRGMAGLHADVHDYRQQGVVAHYAIDRAHQSAAWQWFGGDDVMALLPLAARDPAMVSLVWSLPTARAEEFLQDTAALDAAVQARAEETGWAFTRANAPRAFPLRLLKVSPLTAGRVALVGDAAHVVHPLAGQGLNLGLGDVQALVHAVTDRERFRSPGDARVLARYARARAQSTTSMRVFTDVMSRLFAPTHPLSALAGPGMSTLAHIGVLRATLTKLAVAQ